KYIRTKAKPVLKGDKIYKISGIYQDVTELKKKDSFLTLFKTIIDNVEDLIYVYNDKGDLLHYSKSLMDKLGYTKEELDQMNMFDLDKDVTPEFYEAHFDMLRAKGSHNFEWSISRKDGTLFPVDIMSSHLTYYEEDYCCSVARDISIRKKRDIELYT